MERRELKVTRIGNSRGVRIPADTLARYEIGDSVVMEERSDGILLRPSASAPPRLSWAETAREMAAATEDWTAWETTTADGLEAVPWDPPGKRRVAEPTAPYETQRRRKK